MTDRWQGETTEQFDRQFRKLDSAVQRRVMTYLECVETRSPPTGVPMCYGCYTDRMKTIAHRELRNNSADVLRSVQAGESFEVTNNGEVVALLTPPNSVALRGVRYRAELTRGGFSDLPRVSSALSVNAVLDELRAER